MSEIRVNTFKAEDGISAPSFPNGIQVTGIITSTVLDNTVAGDLAVTGNVSVGGTLTYEDVKNVDSLGIGTFRTGINVSGGQLDVGSNIKLGNAGVITATSFIGNGAGLTGITQTAINNNADNRIITGSGTANTLNGEASCTFDGTAFIVNSSDSVTSHAGTSAMQLKGGDAVNDYVNLSFRGNAYAIGGIHGKTEGISGSNGSGSLTFSTANSGTITERVQINQNGHIYPVANNTYDLGLSSNRWRVIYTNDLELSNKGSQNSVDGTWGDWTLQEGENDIFMINNRSGKKFKINLTEVL